MYWVSKDNNGWYLVVQGQYLRQRLILDRTGTSSTTAGKYHHFVKTREESDCDDYERALRQNTLSKWFQDQKQNIQTHEHLFHERIPNFFTESLIVRRTKDDLTESGNLTWEKHNKSQYEPQLKLKTNSSFFPNLLPVVWANVHFGNKDEGWKYEDYSSTPATRYKILMSVWVGPPGFLILCSAACLRAPPSRSTKMKKNRTERHLQASKKVSQESWFVPPAFDWNHNGRISLGSLQVAKEILWYETLTSVLILLEALTPIKRL